MGRTALALLLATALGASCFPPGVSGPGFRWAPAEIRDADWSERVSKVRATLTVVDEYHGTRVYVVHLPDNRIAEYYLPCVWALDACSEPGGDDAYVLLSDGRIVRASLDLEAPPVFAVKGRLQGSSSIALSPDGSTIALLHQPRNDDWLVDKPDRLTIVDVLSGRARELPGEFSPYRPCWAPDGKSVFLTEFQAKSFSDFRIVQRSLVAEEPSRTIGAGFAPILSQDGKSLLFRSATRPDRDWNGTAWNFAWTCMRWSLDSADAPEELPLPLVAAGQPLAVGKDGAIVHESEPDERLPLEHSGFFMKGPYWRQGISVFDPSSDSTVPLFVGIAPNSIQWRWD